MQVQFSYQDYDGQTVPTWTNRDRLPKAVAINILNQAGVAVFPVPLAMKLPTNMAAACVSGGDGEGGAGCPGTTQRRPRETQTDQ
jgi:hypothetical protein